MISVKSDKRPPDLRVLKIIYVECRSSHVCLYCQVAVKDVLYVVCLLCFIGNLATWMTSNKTY